MASPTSRQTLIDYCLRRLGHPVIEVNVDPDQIEDKVDDALQLYRDYHSDGTLRTYLKYLVTSQNVTDGYFTIPTNINYVSRVFPINTAFGSSRSFFDVKYQMMLNDITNLYSYMGDVAYYEQIQQYMSTLDMVLNGTPQISFSRRQNRIYLWGDFVDGDVKAGDYLVIEVFEIISPDSATSIYNDPFIKNYTTALIKQQWGMNLMKFEGMTLPGGVTLNGRQFYEDATTELETLRENLRLEGEAPVDFFVG
jgi:hypothetical protein